MIGMPRYVVVLPIKRLPVAKSRLAPQVGEQHHRALALALSVDTAAAVVAAQQQGGPVLSVLAVTDDEDARAAVSALGVSTISDSPAAGLNPALQHGAEVAASRQPDSGVALLAADLPALVPGELAAALQSAARHPRAFLSDRCGTGTTLLCAGAGVAPQPQFGPDSRCAHLQSGASELSGPWPSLRGDVDTLTDLRRAAAGALGPRVRALLATLAEQGEDLLGGADPAAALQATVATYVEAAGGTAVLDDGTKVGFTSAAAHAGGWRFLRPGQRVAVSIAPSGRVLRVGRCHDPR